MIFFAMLAIKVLRPLCEHFLFIQIEKIAISQPPVIDGERSVFCGWTCRVIHGLFLFNYKTMTKPIYYIKSTLILAYFNFIK